MKFKIILLSITLLLFLSCSKELDISEFSDDFDNYTTELKIEAIILPTENTAIVRIDRSFQLDDNLPYNCIDDDGDWDPLSDDVGSDGINSVEEGIPIDTDGSEGNGQPDCGEPHVDEYDEILPQIHVYEEGVDSCIVQITHIDSATCIFQFSEVAGDFFYTDGKHTHAATMADIETATYGAYEPGDNCNGFNWQDYDGEYTFSVSCTAFPDYVEITSKEPIQISKPIIFYDKTDHENIKTCHTHDCLGEFSISDTVYFAEHAPDQYIYYASLLESSYYQAVQYHLDKTSGEFKITHEHPDQATDIENIWGNICLMAEKIVTQIFDGDDDGIDEADISKYELFTFNESFTNYYFFDLLNIHDPVRTNLRDGNGDPVMGTFGALASNEIILRIIDCEKFESIEGCNYNSHQVCEWDSNIAKCGFKVSPPPQP